MAAATGFFADLDASRSKHKRSRTEDATSVERLKEAIANPGSVKINVKGAFIIDDHQPESPRSQEPVGWDGVHYEHKDIRLPHHTDVVSHVAVDVSDHTPLLSTPAFVSCYVLHALQL